MITCSHLHHNLRICQILQTCCVYFNARYSSARRVVSDYCGRSVCQVSLSLLRTVSKTTKNLCKFLHTKSSIPLLSTLSFPDYICTTYNVGRDVLLPSSNRHLFLAPQVGTSNIVSGPKSICSILLIQSVQAEFPQPNYCFSGTSKRFYLPQ